MDKYPQLLDSYLSFCYLRSQYAKYETIDLSTIDFYYPTTLLPTINFIKKNSIEFLPHYNGIVTRYIDIITNPQKDYMDGVSYIPIERLPVNNYVDLDSILKRIIDLISKKGTLTAFSYILSELVDNIYEHSECENAFIMAQKYPSKKFVEICIYDDGISIPGSLSKKYDELKDVEDHESIAAALEGYSVKDDGRGHGIRSSIRIFQEGMNGQILIVSRNGAYYINSKNKDFYKFTDKKLKLDGTLISVRVPLSTKEVNIYEYLWKSSINKKIYFRLFSN